jgi:hypothetical protein
MRKAMNDNPQVQLAVIAAVGVIFAFVMFTMVLKKDPAPTDSGAASTPATGTAAPAAATGAPIPDPAVEGADAAAAPAASEVAPPPTAPPAPANGKLEATDGLPKPVIEAYDGGQAVALLVIDERSISDRKLGQYEDRLDGVGGVALFRTDPKNVADYSRIVSGVGLSRTPALVVVKPKSETDGEPLASVTYGFRSPSSAVQALHDALYQGSAATYYPE